MVSSFFTFSNPFLYQRAVCGGRYFPTCCQQVMPQGVGMAMLGPIIFTNEEIGFPMHRIKPLEIEQRLIGNFRSRRYRSIQSTDLHPRSEEHTSELQSRENLVC